MKPRLGLGSRGVQASFVVGLAALWWWLTEVQAISAVFVPKLPAVIADMVRLAESGALFGPLWVTLTTVAAAYAIAAASGIVVGYLTTRSRLMVRTFEPVFSGMFAVPITLFFPLFILFCGIGPQSKVAYGATYAFFPILLNTIAGFANVDERYVAAARSMGATSLQLFRRVQLPAAFPVILTGLRIGFFICFASVLGGETISSVAGIGRNIALAAELMEPARMYAWITFVVCTSVTLNMIMASIEDQSRTA
jgi:ABC-type nitrate/sulfonate/bicarbonate transport system permease component